ncbi:MAG TPA: YraN family protein [Myxococcota bacterium]
MVDTRRALGAEGEARAAAHLVGRGYRILARNVRADGVEIDLVAECAGLVIFVEVKARRSRAQGPPEAAVDARKQARLARGAAAWLRGAPRHYRRARFDVIGCELDRDGRWHLTHWEGAFDAGD